MTIPSLIDMNALAFIGERYILVLPLPSVGSRQLARTQALCMTLGHEFKEITYALKYIGSECEMSRGQLPIE